jgi:cell division septation protein DedD
MADRPPENKRYYFYRDQLVLLGIGFAIASLIIFVLGIMAGRQIERRATPQPSSSAVKVPVSPVPSEPFPQTHSGDTAAGSAVDRDHAVESESQPAKETKAKEKAARAERGKPTPAEKPVNSEPKSPATKPADEKPAAAPEQPQKTQTAEPTAERAWSVQIKSSPDKKFADTWANRLKAKGYDAFVVEGDVKGQTWYRVRVGRFAAKQDAEELRAALESKEGLSGGFLTTTNAADRNTEVRDQKSKVRN